MTSFKWGASVGLIVLIGLSFGCDDSPDNRCLGSGALCSADAGPGDLGGRADGALSPDASVGDLGGRADGAPPPDAGDSDLRADDVAVADEQTAPDAYAAEGISAQQLHTWLDSGVDLTLIDVREDNEFASGHIPGAINMPLNSGVLAQHLDEIPKGKATVVYCASGGRAARAAVLLVQNGFNPVYDLGSINSWTGAGYDLEQ